MIAKLQAYLIRKAKIVGVLCVSLVAIHLVNVSMQGALFEFGIQPRNWQHWYHIFTAPWIHASASHLFNNLVGMAVFSWLCLIRSVRMFVYSSVIIITVSGILVWLFGRDANHIGASGWVFGLWSLSISLAWFDRRMMNIVIAILVILFYGGMVFGMLPQDSSVSFESHLFGALAGVLAAWSSTWAVFRKRINNRREIL